MRRLLAVLAIALSSFWATWLWAQSGTPLTKSGVNAAINSNFPDNTAGSITPFLLRQGLFDIVASMQQYGCVHAVTSTTYTALATDYGCLVTFTNGSNVALSLPAAPTINPFNAFFTNYGPGDLIITPSVSTIGGASSFTVHAQQGVWVVSDGTNYQVFIGGGTGGGITIGAPIVGSSANGILYNTISNTLADNGPVISASGGVSGAGQWSIGATTSGGIVMSGQGTTNDVQIQNSVGTNVIIIPTSSGFVNLPGLQTSGTIANSICSTATGTLIATPGNNCFAGGGAGSPGGMTGQVQFNTNGSFGGISGVTSDSVGLSISTSTIATLTAGSARFTVLVSGTTAQFQTYTGATLNLTQNLTGTTAQFSSAVTGTTAQFQTYTGSTATLTGNLTGTTAQLSGALTGTTSQMQTRTGATLTLTGNLTGTTAQLSGALTGTTSQMQTRTGATLNLTDNLTGTTANFSGLVIGTTLTLIGNLTGTTAQFSGAVTGTTAKFQTMTVASLTPTGPNCLQETGGVLQATNAACSSAGTPGGVSTNIQVNSNSVFGGDNGFLYFGQAVTPTMVQLTQGIITSNSRALQINTNWNRSGTKFDGALLINVTNSGSAAGSYMFNAQAGGLTVFGAQPNVANLPNGNALQGSLNQAESDAGLQRWNLATNAGNQPKLEFSSGSSDGAGIFWYTARIGESSPDTSILRDGPQTIGIRSGTLPQELAVYNTWTSAAVNEHAIFSWNVLSNTLAVGTTKTGATALTRNLAFVVGGITQDFISNTSTSVQTSLNVPNIAQLATNTTGYVCWTTGTGALSEDSTTCLASLRSLKQGIAPFSGATTELMALKPSAFEWKQPADRNQQGRQLGFIAEDVAAVDPRLSTHASDGNLRGWQEPGMIALLVAGFQEQQREIAQLKAELARVNK